MPDASREALYEAVYAREVAHLAELADTTSTISARLSGRLIEALAQLLANKSTSG